MQQLLANDSNYPKLFHQLNWFVQVDVTTTATTAKICRQKLNTCCNCRRWTQETYCSRGSTLIVVFTGFQITLLFFVICCRWKWSHRPSCIEHGLHRLRLPQTFIHVLSSFNLYDNNSFSILYIWKLLNSNTLKMKIFYNIFIGILRFKPKYFTASALYITFLQKGSDPQNL